jgi:hypothetical protein
MSYYIFDSVNRQFIVKAFHKLSKHKTKCFVKFVENNLDNIEDNTDR